jgi:hypothetical protein
MMGIMVPPKHVEQAIRSAIKTHLLHLVGILFPHIIDDARSKPHKNYTFVDNSAKYKQRQLVNWIIINY